MVGLGRSRKAARGAPAPSVLSMITLIGLVGLFASTKIDTSVLLQPAALPTPEPYWVKIERPIEVFALPLPQFDGLERQYRAERLEGARGRRDTIIRGSLDGSSTYLAVSIHREATGAAGFKSTVHTLSGVEPGEPGPSAAMTTKFGAVPTAEIALADRACLAFDLFEPAVQASFAGVFCPPAGKVADRRTLACTLDRLDLIAAGSDTALRRHFAEAERRRDFCGMGQVASVGTKPKWLDADGEQPRLRD